MIGINRKRVTIAGLTVIVMVIAIVAFQRIKEPALSDDFASGNGRLESTEIDITTKFPGRLNDVAVKEGDNVTAGQVLARMDVRELEADLNQAKALVTQARKQRSAAEAIIVQRESEVTLAEKNLERARELYENKNISIEQLQRSETAVQTAQAIHEAAKAELAHAEAAIDAARARVESVITRIDDSTLKTPLSGQVLYRLAEPGEVLPSGGKVFTVLDLNNMFMTIFLPTQQAGRLRIGDEARIMMDAFPEYVFPATVTFVSPEAQFTPKAVETHTEREKLMFRVKVRIDPTLLPKYGSIMKTGVPGVAYVRLGSTVEWPETLTVRLPQ